jgi:hypothetical protein
MTTIVTRAGKGSALTWTEGDANVTNLNNAKLENVVEDTTPQLGGSLDVNGQSIVSVSNGNIAIVPNGTGNISLTPSTGKITLGALDFPTGMGSNGQVLTTNGTSAMSWSTPSSGGSISVAVLNVTSATSTVVSGNIYRLSLSETADPSNIVSLSTSAFTLAAGTYTIQLVGILGQETNGGTETTALQLYNITADTSVWTLRRSSETFVATPTGVKVVSEQMFVITPTASTQYDFRQNWGGTTYVMRPRNSTNFIITKIA